IRTSQTQLLGTTTGIIVTAVAAVVGLVVLLVPVFLAGNPPDVRRLITRRRRQVSGSRSTKEISSGQGPRPWERVEDRDVPPAGNLAGLVAGQHVVGVTSRPSIFAKPVSQGPAYDQQTADLAIRDVSIGEASRAITTYDIRWACDVLRPVYDTTAGMDGRVSLEVDPRIARDTAKTIAEARALWWLVDRPNLFIKIPATEQGLPAIAQCLSEGIR